MDFEISDKMKAVTGMINEFLDKELIPLEHDFLTKNFTLLEPVIEEKRRMVRQMELWAPNQPEEYGGMGPHRQYRYRHCLSSSPASGV